MKRVSFRFNAMSLANLSGILQGKIGSRVEVYDYAILGN